MYGKIFDIQRACTSDGPGIRTTVFFKGCPLRCAWCHNPESRSMRYEILYDSSLCVACGRCVPRCLRSLHKVENGVHTYKRDGCITCGDCAGTGCRALKLCGETVSSEKIIETVLRDRVYYERSGGGLTLSGGEPMMQSGFAAELLSAAKENGIGTCIETCGYASAGDWDRVLPYTDLFCFDYKLSDPELHEKYTSVTPDRILRSLAYLDSKGAQIILRCPIIPGINNTQKHFGKIAETADKYPSVREIQLEPYHPLGLAKYASLGICADYTNPDIPSRAEVDGWIAEIGRQTAKPVKKA